MTGMHVTEEEMTQALTSGQPLTSAQQAHLPACSSCRDHWALLLGLQDALLLEAATPPTSPPASVRAALLARAARMPTPEGVPLATAARPAVRRWSLPRLALSAAAALAALTVTGTLLVTSDGQARALPDPAVVVNAGGRLLVASNGRVAGTLLLHKARLTLISGDRVSATLDVPAPSPAWFTEGVRLGDRVYLADAANDRVLEVQARPLKLLNSFPVRGGVAGLSVGNGRVYFKAVRGEVGLLPKAGAAGRSVSLTQEDAMPMADVMDGVLFQAGTLYVTHHLRGELYLLNPQTLAIRQRLHLGGAPVALEAAQGGLLVLDVQGRLLRLDNAGRVQQTWRLSGQPDKLVVNDEQAIVTDRAGRVTRIDLPSGRQSSILLTHPMDVALTDDGLLAVAEGQTGVTLLGADLKRMPGGEIR
ncbi:MAG: YncE family protein [Deinococcus sp.]